MARIEAWGTPAFLIVPNAYHRLDAPAFKTRYPNAKVLCPRAATKKVGEVVTVDGTYDDFPADAAVRFEGLEGSGDSEGVMIVESSPSMQDLFRDRLKKRGYRVLVISDSARALQRLAADPCPADCVVFSAGHLGRDSLESFNKLSKIDGTKDLPAVLLLGRGQASWAKIADLGSHRVILSMPIKFREFRQVLIKLFRQQSSPDQGDLVP